MANKSIKPQCPGCSHAGGCCGGYCGCRLNVKRGSTGSSGQHSGCALWTMIYLAVVATMAILLSCM